MAGKVPGQRWDLLPWAPRDWFGEANMEAKSLIEGVMLGAGGWRVGGCVRGGWGLGELEEVSAGWEVHALAGELERRWVSGYAVV